LPNPSVCWLLTRASFEGTPLVLHWHSDVLTDNQGVAMRALYRFYRPLERMLLERAAAIIATSSSYLQTSESLKDYPEKCHVVPLGLDGARVLSHAPEEQPDRPNDEPFELLAIGRLTYYKGFGFLLRALAELENVRLHIVGTGVLWKELHAIARELKVKRYVTFHGGLDDEALAGRLARCDCVCLPSTERTEAFGLVLLEAMAFGKPTIATRVQGSGMSWVVRDGETGLLVPPRDVQALADAIRTLQNDPERCARLGESGRTRFEQHFAIGPSVDALRTVYERVTTPAVRQ
ncbi:MAG: glycosyltransferase, partial [Pseudomonadota bacterium]